VAFVEVNEGEECYLHKSRLNTLEAQVVLESVKKLLKSSNRIDPGEIGVISPYAAQIALLKRMFKADPEIQRLEREADATVEVKTVDGYQGREKDYIIMTTVVANDYGKVGFLNDWRRVNVALTRAKLGVIVVGHPDTLSYDPHWNNWIGHQSRKEASIDVNTVFGKDFVEIAAEREIQYRDLELGEGLSERDVARPRDLFIQTQDGDQDDQGGLDAQADAWREKGVSVETKAKMAREEALLEAEHAQSEQRLAA